MMEKVLADRYRLVEQIGIGGMAIVYRAVDKRTGHDVAVKVLKPEFNQNAEFVSRFQREAEAASKMTHHNIVNLLDVGMDGGNRYLVMEYVPGKTLKQVIQEKGRLNTATAVQITIRILAALQHAHQNGIIHRDIKPQNILVHADGHIKVADFGIARIANASTLTHDDSVMGTVHYLSPEQASGGDVRETSDIYSVGVVLYEMLTGRVPFDGDNYVAIAMQHLKNKPAPIEQFAPETPPAVCRVCMTALEKNPRFRYQSATDMAMDLRRALEGRYDEMTATAALEQMARQNGAVSPQQPRPQGQQSAKAADRSRQDSRPKRIARIAVTLLIAAAVFAGLYVGSVQIYDYVVNTTSVPLLTGETQEAAEYDAAKAGLTVTVVTVSSTATQGQVISQMPENGASIRKGDTVVITVSSGPSTQSLPAVTGMTVTEAADVLSRYGLTYTVVERVVSMDTAADIIVSQSPEAGSECHSGDIVQLAVSGGYALVPDCTGATLEEAKEMIRSAGLSLNATLQYIETDDPSLHNHVSMQTPTGNTEVILGASVTLSIYRDPAQTHTAQITLELPESQTEFSLRVTLSTEEGETLIYQGTVATDATRHPVLEISTQESGTYTYRVYVDDQFRYQQQVQVE